MDMLNELLQARRTRASHNWLTDALLPEDALVSACGIDLFYGRNPLNQNELSQLLLLPELAELKPAIHMLFAGDLAAGHTQSRENYLLSTPDWELFHRWAHALRQGRTPQGSESIDTVIHLGTGGSRFGPELLIDTLQTERAAHFTPYFVSSQDTRVLQQLLQVCDPCKTIVLVVSKSFATTETLANATLARDWLAQHDRGQHLLAITAEPQRAANWGCQQVLPFSPQIGGRYSISSAVALIAAAYLNETAFASFMAGMHEMDQHFLSALWHENLPVLLALLGVYARNCCNVPTRCIVPYAPRLRLLVPYLQQLLMESLGKPHATHATCPVIWGGVATDSQHSFHQLLMQGTDRQHIDFIIPKDDTSSRHNALAQAQLLQREAGQSSVSLLLPCINARTLGCLIALYEHQCFTQSILWGINCFDQPGVEAGKMLAQALERGESRQMDASCEHLLKVADPRIPTG